jgi:ABC-type transport system involved in cytochrome c biogenesis permease component
MRGLGNQLRASLRLYFRNRMALFYGYLFPTIFLLSFWVLYRYDRVPLVRHVGALLTVTILGGACFGLPTTIVSDRERGVWRRFKLTPVPVSALVVSTILARFIILLSAGLLQMTIAVALGMPLPVHMYGIWVSFTFAAFAFLGLGLVIAAMADNVPAVQALGQSIFLPMLIIGGVAVRLDALPEWAQHLSAFFPGRYAVDAIQSTMNGEGLDAAGYSLLALATIGIAACIAGGRMFRWDSQQRFAASGGRGWLAVALAAWIAVGIGAEYRGYVQIFAPQEPIQATNTAPTPAPPTTSAATPSTFAPTPSVAEQAAVSIAGRSATPAAQPPAKAAPATTAGTPPSPTPAAPATIVASPGGPGRTMTITSAPAPSSDSEPCATPTDWRAVTMADVDREFAFNRLPPDGGVVIPVAAADQEIDADTAAELNTMGAALDSWPPGKVADPVQRVRNLLYVPAVVDVFQWPTEPFVPHLIFERLQREFPRDDLIKLLYWVGCHASQGSVEAIDQMQSLGIKNGPGDVEEVRGRSGVYAAKLLGRVTGRRPGR